MPFAVSSIVLAHKSDVRCICSTWDGKLISGSRDGSAKLWVPKQAEPGVGQQWHCQTAFSGHQGFVSSVTTRVPDEQYPNGLVYTGCQDGGIRAFDPDKSEPIFTLRGHSANVVSLFVSKASTLLSGSWDHTAKVWLNERQILTLEGHTMGVWAVIVLPETGIMVTGSADKTIRLWKAGRCKKVLEHHTQSVRDLAVVSSNEFLSCANDHVIHMFKILNEDKLDTEVVFRYEDVDYIYSLAIRNPPTSWVASGEHIGLRVFQHGEMSDYLPVPTSSVWSTCVLPNGDVAAACSDAKVYIFSQDSARFAPDDIQAVFQAEVDRFTQSSSNGATSGSESNSLPAEIGGVKIEDIPGPEALRAPGKRDGMTKMIREGNTISVHSWSQDTGEWSKIGDMISDPDKTGQTVNNGGKVFFEGQEYDHVFNIDVDDNVVLKLPYNNDQDPYHVAQQFIYKHELPQSYLDEIANFIFKNSGHSSAPVGLACDPFTGSGAYVSGSGGVPTAKDFSDGSRGSAVSGGLDPFTGSGAYVSGSGGVPTAKDIGFKGDPFTGSGAYVSGSASSEKENNFFPMKSYLSFSQLPKMEALKSKLQEFNSKISEDRQLYEQDIGRLLEIPNSTTVREGDITLLIRALRWPSSSVFPCLDIARLSVLSPNFSQSLTAIDELATDLLEIVILHVRDASNQTNRMLALRVLSNLFVSNVGSSLMAKLQNNVFAEIASCLPTENKNVQIALSTLLLNYSVLACKDIEGATVLECVNLCLLFLEAMSDPEAKFRTLVALGTLLSNSSDARKSAADLEILSRVKTWREIGEVPKIVECADFILKLA